jgi:hypothetical protein
LSKSLAVFESWSLFRKQLLVGSISGPLRSGGLIERLGHACLDWFGSLSRYLLSERAKLLHSARKRYRIACGALQCVAVIDKAGLTVGEFDALA